MPELPEVETMVKDLKKQSSVARSRTVWSDSPKNIKRPKTFSQFVKKVKRAEIEGILRRGKV